jgi:hypothetical protein
LRGLEGLEAEVSVNRRPRGVSFKTAATVKTPLSSTMHRCSLKERLVMLALTALVGVGIGPEEEDVVVVRVELVSVLS